MKLKFFGLAGSLRRRLLIAAAVEYAVGHPCPVEYDEVGLRLLVSVCQSLPARAIPYRRLSALAVQVVHAVGLGTRNADLPAAVEAHLWNCGVDE